MERTSEERSLLAQIAADIEQMKRDIGEIKREAAKRHRVADQRNERVDQYIVNPVFNLEGTISQLIENQRMLVEEVATLRQAVRQEHNDTRKALRPRTHKRAA